MHYRFFLQSRVCSVDGNGFTDLFPVVKTFIVVVALGNTFPLSLITGGVCVHDVTGQEILPERKALRR